MRHGTRLSAITAVCLGCVLAYPRLSATEPEGVDIGSRRELFVDQFLIDRLDGARFQLHHPFPAEQSVVLDQPWERRFEQGISVVRDGDRFLLYYSANNRLAVAESRDGVVWVKPRLGLIEIDGSRENNLVGTSDGRLMIEETRPLPEVFLDARPGVADEQRFKAFTLIELPGVTKVIGWVSADGFAFRKLREEPIIEMSMYGAFDGFESLFWSQAEQQYVVTAHARAPECDADDDDGVDADEDIVERDQSTRIRQ